MIFKYAGRAAIGLALLAWPGVAGADQLTVLCSNGLRAVIQDLIPAFERTSGHQVSINFSVAAELKKRIDAGERFDVAILTPPLVDQLIQDGKVTRESRRAIARSGMALAMRSGGSKADVQSVDRLKATLTAAPTIAFAREGAGGVFFTALLQRLDLADLLAPTLRPVTTGQDVSAMLARGDAALGILPLSEVLAAPGVELAGMFPPEVQDYAVMVGAIGRSAEHPAVAEALLQFLMSSSADSTVEKRGMERVLSR